MIVPFPPATPPVIGLVQFNAPEFQAAYSDFANTPEASLETAFGVAEQFIENDQWGVIQDANRRQAALYAATAHFTFLLFGTAPASSLATPAPASNLTGRITSAKMGSVEIATELGGGTASATQSFWAQSKYGLIVWQMLAPYKPRGVPGRAGSPLAGLVPPLALGHINLYGPGIPYAEW